ncbi:MAG: hypothetical protein U9R72_14995 [Chloroflexota bacterium]|nr:hypothetical protein [Chloroflexota bacterium]
MSVPSRSVVREESLALATLLLISLIAAGPLWGPGLLNTRGGGDSPFLLLRTHQLAVNLRAGVFPARWMPDAAYGYGYPFFSYYAALPYYLAAGFTVVGLNILSAIKLTQTLFFAAAAVAMYHWAAGILRSRAGAWLAAVAYVSAPFHLVNVYVRGDSLSEFAAFAFYPLIFLGFDRLADEPTLKRTVPPALAYAGLITTHNASALIFSPFILIYVGFHVLRFALRGSGLVGGRDSGESGIRRSESRSSSYRPQCGDPGKTAELTGQSTLSYCLWLILPLLAALLLSAWFWLPALGETESVQLDAQVTGYFFYGNHFRGSDIVQWRPVFNYATGRTSGSPFATGLVQAVLALAGVVVVGVSAVSGTRRHWRRQSRSSVEPRSHPVGPARWTLGFGALGLCVSTWLITPLSRPLWDNLPLLAMIQFPWRFLSVQAVFTALLTGAVIGPLGHRSGFALSWASAALLGGLLTVAALAGLRPEYLPIRADEVTAERLQLYELFTGNIGSTIRHEYLPRWVQPRPYTGSALFKPDAPARAFPIEGTVSRAQRLERRPTLRVWEVEARDGAATVAFPLYYWPGWEAAVDGSPVAVEPVHGSGYVSVDVPPGAHIVEMRLGRTRLRLWCEIASLTAAGAMLGVWMLRRWQRAARREGREHDETEEKTASRLGSGRFAVAYAPYFLALVLLLAFHPRVDTASSDLTMDFQRMPYLHHNPDGVTFDTWRMSGYDYDEERIAPGDALKVTFDWETTGDGPASAELRLISPASVRNDMVAPVAQTTSTFGQAGHAETRGRTTATLSVPGDAAPGIYLPQIVGEPPVTLRPVWIHNGDTAAGEPLLASFAEGAARLHGVRVTQPKPDRLGVQLDWSAAKPVGANYGVSLSLTDTAGNEWLHQGGEPGYDTQPGHGFLPTSLWPVDRVIRDRHTVTMTPGAPPSDSYSLTIDLYHVATWESVGTHKTVVSLTQAVTRPDAPIVARLGDELALSHLEIPRSVWQGDTVEVTAYWVAVETPSQDYIADWRLTSPVGSITRTHLLAPGSSPVDWPAGAWIAGRMQLAIPPSAPGGDYRVSLTLRDPVSGTSIGSYTHPTPVEIQERERTWELPPMDRRVAVRFGDMIELAGYDLRQARDRLHLTLHWQALTTPDRHYVFFVHLADPETGQPVRQVDGMPRGFTYPTGIWAPGEVVSDEVTLSLKDVPAGRYDLVVGWYDPQTRLRLQAADEEGSRLPDDRLHLPDGISVP